MFLWLKMSQRQAIGSVYIFHPVITVKVFGEKKPETAVTACEI